MWVDTGANRFFLCMFVSCAMHADVHVKVCVHACGCVYGKRDSSLIDTEPAPCLRWRHDLEASLSPSRQSPLSSLPLASSTAFPHQGVQNSSGYQREQRLLFQPFREAMGGMYQEL